MKAAKQLRLLVPEKYQASNIAKSKTRRIYNTDLAPGQSKDAGAIHLCIPLAARKFAPACRGHLFVVRSACVILKGFATRGHQPWLQKHSTAVPMTQAPSSTT